MKIHPNCRICNLYKGCKNPFMRYTGKGELKILIIGEAPGEDEDEENIQFIGRCGQLFRKLLKEMDLDLDRDFWKTNSIRCRPPNNRNPKKKELDLCFNQLTNEIIELNPKGIICVGRIAMNNIYKRIFKLDDIGITKMHGKVFVSPKKGIKITAIYHPSYLLRKHSNELNTQFKQDIDRFIKLI